MAQRIRKAVFPVGGLGTRFLPATKSMPKEMLPVVDKPLIQYAVEEAQAAGIEEFIFVTGARQDDDGRSFRSFLRARGHARGARQGRADRRRQFLDAANRGRWPTPVSRKPLGLGHAVWCARNLVGDEPFAVLLADDLILAETPCLKQLVEAHASTGGSLVAVMEVPHEHTNRYGVLDIAGDDGRLVAVKGVVEKPDPKVAPSNLSIIGRYILQPEVFDHLAHIGRGAGNEIQLTDALAELIGGNKPFHGLRFDGRRFDCGDKVGWLQANIAFALARPDMAPAVRRILDEYC